MFGSSDFSAMIDYFSDYNIIREIGEGATSTVFLAQHMPSQQFVAIKVILINYDSNDVKREINSFLKEIELMKSLDYEFIVKIYDYYISDNIIAIAMELCSEGSLAERIMMKGCLNQRQVVMIIYELISAIRVLHSQKIIHRDIKLENILLDKHGHIRISDFGISRRIDNSEKKELTFCGSPLYASPEMIKRDKYNEKTDVWSIGIVVYYMLFNKFPFFSENIQNLYQKILREEPEIPDDCDINLKSFVLGLLHKNPATRLTLNECLEHPFLRKNIDLGNFVCKHCDDDINEAQFNDIVRKISEKTSLKIDSVKLTILNNKRCSLASFYRIIRDKIIESHIYKEHGDIDSNYIGKNEQNPTEAQRRSSYSCGALKINKNLVFPPARRVKMKITAQKTAISPFRLRFPVVCK